MQAAKIAPRRQLSDRIYLVLFNSDTQMTSGTYHAANISNQHADALAAGR
jgi:hypothetical protein